MQADQARQQEQAAAVGHQADFGKALGKFDGAGAEHQVAGQGDVEAGAGGDAVDHGDHRLLQVQDGLHVGPRLADEVAAGRRSVQAGEVIQVAAGAKGFAAAGQDHDPDRGVLANVRQHRRQLGGQGLVQGVHGRRPVQGDGGDFGVFSQQNRFFFHLSSFFPHCIEVSGQGVSSAALREEFGSDGAGGFQAPGSGSTKSLARSHNCAVVIPYTF